MKPLAQATNMKTPITMNHVSSSSRRYQGTCQRSFLYFLYTMKPLMRNTQARIGQKIIHAQHHFGSLLCTEKPMRYIVKLKSINGKQTAWKQDSRLRRRRRGRMNMKGLKGPGAVKGS